MEASQLVRAAIGTLRASLRAWSKDGTQRVRSKTRNSVISLVRVEVGTLLRSQQVLLKAGTSRMSDKRREIND